MQHLNYINSSGFNQLLKILSTTRNHGGDTYLCNINSSIDALLITTKLNTIFTIKQETKNLSDFKNYSLKYCALSSPLGSAPAVNKLS